MDAAQSLAAFLAQAPAEVRTLHERLAALGMTGTYRKYLENAGPAELHAFFSDLARVDFDHLARHRAALLGEDAAWGPRDLVPIQPAVLRSEPQADLIEVGRASLANGEWAVLVFAGGASTRFYAEAHRHPKARKLVEHHGFEPPKGLFPVGPVSGRCFLEVFAAETLASGVAHGRMPFFLLLTSVVTDEPIREWLRSSALWGFPKELAWIVQQAAHPRLDMDGDLVAGPDGRLLWTGDGHGGAFRAILSQENGDVAGVLRRAGVRGLVVHNVDNAAARALDPARIGFHVRTGARMTLGVVPRMRMDEKVGLVAKDRITGRIEVFEYSACPPEVAEAMDPEGLPRFRLAHICTNLVSLDAIRADLPATLYRGKRVRIGDREVMTSSLERLNQHLSSLLPAEQVQVLLLEREEFFLPTKTLTGPDSHETTVAALCEAGRRRLRQAGAWVHDRAEVEFDPCLSDLHAAGIGPDWRVAEQARIFLGVRHGVHGNPPFAQGLTVGERATLKVEAEFPYGRLRVARDTRAAREDPDTAGRVRIGPGVRIEPGCRFEAVIGEGGTLVVAGRARLSGTLEIRVPAREWRVIGPDGTIQAEGRE